MYRLQLHDDGLLEYVGIREVATAGYCTAQLSADRVAALTELMAPLDSEPEEASAFDAPVVIFSRSNWDGGTKMFDVGLRTRDQPEPLANQLADTVDRLVGSSRWVGDGGVTQSITCRVSGDWTFLPVPPGAE